MNLRQRAERNEFVAKQFEKSRNEESQRRENLIDLFSKANNGEVLLHVEPFSAGREKLLKEIQDFRQLKVA